jgi:hypothetical protein
MKTDRPTCRRVCSRTGPTAFKPSPAPVARNRKNPPSESAGFPASPDVPYTRVNHDQTPPPNVARPLIFVRLIGRAALHGSERRQQSKQRTIKKRMARSASLKCVSKDSDRRFVSFSLRYLCYLLFSTASEPPGDWRLTFYQEPPGGWRPTTCFLGLPQLLAKVGRV